MLVAPEAEGQRATLEWEKISNRGKIKRGLTYGVLIGIVAVIVLAFYSADRRTWTAILKIRLDFLLLVLVCLFCMWAVQGLELSVLTQVTGKKVPFVNLVAVFLAGNFVGFVTPFSSGTLPAQIYFLNREGVSWGESTAVVATRALLSSWFFGIIGPVLFFTLKPYFLSDSSWLTSFSIVFGVLFLFTLFFFYFLWRTQEAKSFFSTCLKWRLLHRLFGKTRMEEARESICSEIDYLSQGLRAIFRFNLLRVGIVFLLVVLDWSLLFTIAWLLLKGLQGRIVFSSIFFKQIVLFFLLPLSPTPGGSGAAELGFAALLNPSLSHYLVSLYIALWRFFTFYLSLFAGGICLTWLRRKSVLKESNAKN